MSCDRFRSLLVAGLVCAGLAACGGGGDGNDGDDNTPPTIVLTSPANLADGLTGSVALTAEASDDEAVQQVAFQVDGVAVGAPDDSVPYEAMVDTSNYAAGQHVVRARATDQGGNVSEWTVATVRFVDAAAQPAGFEHQADWVSGLSLATAMAQAPDGRLFVAEQGGLLRVVKDGVLLPTPFATLTVDSSGERGLIGVALHPDFENNGWVYVYATHNEGGVSHNRILRFTTDGDVASAAGGQVLVDLPALSDATNHNGGALHFGPDGKLYLGVGENADRDRAQDTNDPFGKLLRFNDDGTVPTDNPFFAESTGLGRAVWAYGLRNPYTFAFQPDGDRLFINDVGEVSWEEINVGVAGANYGWPGSEGPDGGGDGITAPLLAYAHEEADPPGSGPGGFLTGSAISGGAFYPAEGPYPDGYRSQYYFSDFISGDVWRMDLGNDNAVYAFAKVNGSPVDLRVGIDGAVYVLKRDGITRFAALPVSP